MRRFAQVDVFTSVPGLGNPVAVVVDAEGLTDGEMARLANWTNLSETTFVLPALSPGADYRVRIFTPAEELPFAGHPTLGTCHALLDAGVLKPGASWVQECAAGPITITATDGDGLSFTAPTPSVSASPLPPDALAAVLGGVVPGDPLLVDVGPRWLTARVGADQLDALDVDGDGLLAALGTTATGLTLYAVDAARVVHVRSLFGDGSGLVEDPVCGSGNAAVAVHLTRTGRAGDVPRVYDARQGRHRGRDGHLRVALGDDAGAGVRVGGPAVTVVRGTISI
jgi:PhzF family phenazine biosynthesis protein